MNRVLILSTAVLLVLTGTILAGTGAFLGVIPEQLDEELAEKLDYKGRGVYVSSVVDDGPAEKAGMEDHTVIVELGGDKVVGPGHLRELLSFRSPGDEVKVKVWKDGKTKSFTVKLGKREDHLKGIKKTVVIQGEPKAWLGVSVQGLSEQLEEYFGVDEGVLVAEVVDDSPAKKAGIEAGDVITKVDDEEVEREFDLPNIISDKEPGTEVTIHLVRDRRKLTQKVELGEIPEGLRKKKRVFLWRSDDEDESCITLDEDGLIGLNVLGFPGKLEIPKIPDIDIEVHEEIEREMEELRDFNKNLNKEIEELRKELEELKKRLKE